MSRDFVDALLDQWKAELPDERFEELGVFSRLTRYGRLAARTIYANIEQFGLNETQFNLLCALHRAGDPYQLSPKELSASMLVTSGAITYVIDQMEDAGNVQRLPDPLDRRGLIVQLTPDGKQRIEEAARSHQQVCKELLAPLGQRGQKNLTNALRTLLVAIDDGPLPATAKRDSALSS
jgi:DNA-binding MarR family transcriptional regulator